VRLSSCRPAGLAGGRGLLCGSVLRPRQQPASLRAWLCLMGGGSRLPPTALRSRSRPLSRRRALLSRHPEALVIPDLRVSLRRRAWH
jgi:hypothetical protein